MSRTDAPTIVGAGLAGLIAAHAWPTANVLEMAPGPSAAHAALLRFRSDAVARAVGVEFRKVRVRKGIYLDGAFVPPSIRAANLYSAKVLPGARLEERSIWSIEAADRFVAPESLYEQLIESVWARIRWGVEFDWEGWREHSRRTLLVNTAPMYAALEGLGAEGPLPMFARAPITVQRFRIPNSDVFQTVYFPTEEHTVYRASITGSLLIVEHAAREPLGEWWWDVERAFAFRDAIPLDTVSQSFGKIAPIDDAERKRWLFWMTHEHGVYSLGRFATWRNILLDDVVNDISVIKRLMRSAAAHYDTRRQAAGQ